MDTVRQIKKILRLHNLIQKENTGTATDLSIKLGIPLRTIQYYLQELREYGAIISFDEKSNTYRYENNFSLIFTFEVKVSSEKNNS